MSSAAPAPAPFGRRAVRVTSVERHGPYVRLRLADTTGPLPAAGQFYMLQTTSGWGAGHDGRPYLPRALSFARAARRDDAVELAYLLEPVGPGTRRLAACEPGDQVWIAGPFGNGFSIKPDARTVLVAGGVGLAPIVALSDALTAAGAAARTTTLVGMRDAACAAVTAAYGLECRHATDDGSAGHHGYVTELLERELDGVSGGESTVVYACGPPPMLEAVRVLCKARGVTAQLALESKMACGFGACHGCVAPTRDGYVRLCVDGPVVLAERLESAVFAGAGHE